MIPVLLFVTHPSCLSVNKKQTGNKVTFKNCPSSGSLPVSPSGSSLPQSPLTSHLVVLPLGELHLLHCWLAGVLSPFSGSQAPYFLFLSMPSLQLSSHRETMSRSKHHHWILDFLIHSAFQGTSLTSYYD